MVDHHHRRAGAGREALLFLLEEDAPVGGSLADLDAERLLGMGQQLFGAQDWQASARQTCSTWRPGGALRKKW